MAGSVIAIKRITIKNSRPPPHPKKRPHGSVNPFCKDGRRRDRKFLILEVYVNQSFLSMVCHKHPISVRLPIVSPVAIPADRVRRRRSLLRKNSACCHISYFGGRLKQKSWVTESPPESSVRASCVHIAENKSGTTSATHVSTRQPPSRPTHLMAHHTPKGLSWNVSASKQSSPTPPFESRVASSSSKTARKLPPLCPAMGA
jgi:hypothetical protein